jgi:hypothetical protein
MDAKVFPVTLTCVYLLSCVLFSADATNYYAKCLKLYGLMFILKIIKKEQPKKQ